MDAKMEETRADVELLLECIKCQMTYPEAVRQALVTLASMCSTQENVKDILRERDGLKFIANLLTSGADMSVKEAAMFSLGCAVESNVLSQKMLCQSSMFVYLHKVLVARQTSVRPIQAATFLILALTTNNSVGQTLVRESECLEVLLGLFKSSLPPSTRPDETWFENVKPQSIELWTSVTSALSACVNNPQNEENQRMCSIVFPYAFHLLQTGMESYLLRPIASFIGLAVANNVHNQGRVEQCGGLKILINAVNGRMAKNSVDLQLAIALTNTIDTVITDHCSNAACCGSLDGIALFLRLLQSDLDPAAYLQIVLTLAHCTDVCVSNQQEVVRQGGISILIQKLTQSRDEALTNAVKYVLQTCVHVDSSFEQRPMTPMRANLQPLPDIVIKSPQERNPEKGTVSQFSADNITQRLDSLEASLLSASARTPSDVYTEKLCSTAAHANTGMAAPPTQCDMATGMSTVVNVGGRTDIVQHKASSAGGIYPVLSSASHTDITSQRQVGTSTCEDLMCQVDDSEQETTTQVKLHRGLASVDRPLCQLDSGRGRRALHAAQLTAELQRQELDQQKKDSRCEKEADSVRRSVQKLPGQSPAAPTSHKGEDRPSDPTKRQPTITGGHQAKIGVSTSHCQPGTVNRVPPQSNHAAYRLGNTRESGSSKSTSTILSRCTSNSCGKSKTKPQFSSVGPNRKTVVPAKTQSRVATTIAHVESDDDRVFRKPSLPLRRKPRTSCASTGPYEAHKRRLFAGDGNDAMLKLQPVVVLRPLPQQCTTMRAVIIDPCPSPARSEFDVQLMKTATEAWVRDSPWTQTGQPRAGRLASGQTDPGSGRTHRQTHSDRPSHRGSHNSNVPQSSHYSTDSDMDSDTNDRTARTKYCRQKLDKLRCPGCQPPERIQGGSCLLNSYTYNIAVETSSGTCRAHREMRESERRYMHTLRQGLPKGRHSRRRLHKYNRRLEVTKKETDDSVDVYHFPTEPSSSESVSPPGSIISVASSTASVTRSVTDRRRPRVPYTRLEEDNLTEGVQRFRRSWTQILHSYDFHPSRTAVDLKEKYRRLMAKVEWTPGPAEKTVMERRPFSMVEERRLRRGVHQFGYNWKVIQGAFRFAKGRTAIELRNRWRGMHRPR